ncbi:MAG: NAD(P)-dependent oxidoreductase [Muribaculaceae bacterium]|nr:NAD(P)-dependent oxidoreductase [Muribaculaceae bacterium]
MGKATVEALLCEKDNTTCLRLLVRPSKKNRRLVKKWLSYSNVKVVWGDLLNIDKVKQLIENADIVLHMGGLVSPKADYVPELTLKVNVEAVKNLINAITDMNQSESTRFVYIGSVAQYGPRAVPLHWGGPGDPMLPAMYDYYALSKILAERIVVESNLKRWVSLRQSGILSKELLYKGNDPITFHVPINGVLEWSTVEDSAALMTAICRTDVSEEIWGHFFDIGSGKSFRLTNYEFETMLLKALSCPPPEKIFEVSWFAQRNFHGIWYWSSDHLNQIVPFRKDITAMEYFRNMSKKLPIYFRLANLIPASIIKLFMRYVASDTKFGPLGWKKEKNEAQLNAFFIPGPINEDWPQTLIPKPSVENKNYRILDLGYDRQASSSDLCLKDMQSLAQRRGGICLSETMITGDMKTSLVWKCNLGHVFYSSPAAVALGGHWCPECSPWPTLEKAYNDPLVWDVYITTHPDK